MRASFPEIMDDDDLRVGMIEGETDLNEVVAKLVYAAQLKKALAEGIGQYVKRLKDREARLMQAHDALRGLILQLMQAAALDRLTLPIATLSVMPGQARVEIDDELALPQGFVRIRREPAK